MVFLYKFAGNTFVTELFKPNVYTTGHLANDALVKDIINSIGQSAKEEDCPAGKVVKPPCRAFWYEIKVYNS